MEKDQGITTEDQVVIESDYVTKVFYAYRLSLFLMLLVISVRIAKSVLTYREVDQFLSMEFQDYYSHWKAHKG